MSNIYEIRYEYRRTGKQFGKSRVLTAKSWEEANAAATERLYSELLDIGLEQKHMALIKIRVWKLND